MRRKETKRAFIPGDKTFASLPPTAAPDPQKGEVRRHLVGPALSLAVHVVLFLLLCFWIIEDLQPQPEPENGISVRFEKMPKPDVKPIPVKTEDVSPSPDIASLERIPIERYDPAQQQQMDAVEIMGMGIADELDIPFLPSAPYGSNMGLGDGSPSIPHKVEHFGIPLGGQGDRSLKKVMFQGVFYDLKQTKDRKPTPDFENDSKQVFDTARVEKVLKIMRPFAEGSWEQAYDRDGNIHYPELDRFYASPARLWNSCFLIDEKIEAKDAPKAFQCGKEVEPSAWVCIYSGIVQAPFTGKFRFLGFCDDALIVRFDGNIVLDHGFSHYISGAYTTGAYPTRGGDSAGLGKGLPVDVEKGHLYPVEIMFSEIPGGHFTLGLYIEMLDSNGQPQNPDAKMFPLFRTTSALPDPPTREFPDYDPDGPIWIPEPRTISEEDDDDLSL